MTQCEINPVRRNVRLRVSVNALKSVDHNAGLDAYSIKAKPADSA
jgi:large subunit ribosomal protein L28